MSQKAREYLGSPIFSESISALSAGEQQLFDFNERGEESEKYAPFNLLTIINNSSANALTVYVNQNKARPIRVPAGTIREFDKKSFPGIYSVLVENAGSTSMSAGEGRIEVQKEVIDGETIIQRVAESWFGGII